MRKLLFVLLVTYISKINAETSTISTTGYTDSGVPENDMHCPGSLTWQTFQGANNYLCVINGHEQPESSHHSHIVNAFVEYRTQMVDFDRNDDKAIAPNRKQDACAARSNRDIKTDCTDEEGATVTCTKVLCEALQDTAGIRTHDWYGGVDGLPLSHAGKIVQTTKDADGNWQRSSNDMDEFFRKRFLRTKATLSVGTGENQIYEGCDVQLDGTSLGDLKDYVEFIPNHRAQGTCRAGEGTKLLSQCEVTDLKKFRPKNRDAQCASETGKCEESVLGAAEFRDEGYCTIAVGLTQTKSSSFCEVKATGLDAVDNDGDPITTASACVGNNNWVQVADVFGKVQEECGSCRKVEDSLDYTNQFERQEDCSSGYTWVASTFTKNDDYSCVFYLANNMFLGETSVLVSFHKIPSTVGEGGKAIHSVKIPVGFSPHSHDPNFRESSALKIIDSELQNKNFRDVAISYSDHCEHAGGYVAPSLFTSGSWAPATDANCIAPHSWKTCVPGQNVDGCTFSDAGTVNTRLTSTFIDTRYKISAQSGVERLPIDIGNFLIVKSGLELHQDYRSFNDPTLNDFVSGNDDTIKLTPIKFDHKKRKDQWMTTPGEVNNDYSNLGKDLVGRCLGNQYGVDAITEEANCNGQDTWDDDYPGLQIDTSVSGAGSLDDAYGCDTGTVAEPKPLRDPLRGNCYSQYAMLYTFDWTYGGLPHFKPSYIGCPLCANELIIKGFKEDTDENEVADTYQINTKIPVGLGSSKGLMEDQQGEARNEIVLPGIDIKQVSAAALLEPQRLQKFSFVFEVVTDPNNNLRLDNYYLSSDNLPGQNQLTKQLPKTLDDHFDIHDFIQSVSYAKVVSTNEVCSYDEGVCVDASGERVFPSLSKDACVAPNQFIESEANTCYKDGVLSDGVSCNTGRNLCVRQDELNENDHKPLDVFKYTIDGSTFYSCPDLYKYVFESGDSEVTGAQDKEKGNLKLFRLSADPAGSLQTLFESSCKMYVPENGYGATYKITFDNEYERTLGSCEYDYDDSTVGTIQNVPAEKCTSTQRSIISGLDTSGKTVSTGTFRHTPYVRPLDESIEATVKELKSGRFLRLETTPLSLQQRLAVTSVFQRVATTINMKLSKFTVTDTAERLIFRVRGASATLDGFTAGDLNTQLADECALGPKGTCQKYVDASNLGTASDEFEHLCGNCWSGSDMGNARSQYKSKSQCELRDLFWKNGVYTAPEADIRPGYAWRRHTIREYLCDDAGVSYDTTETDKQWACRVANGTCTGGDFNLFSTSKGTCESKKGTWFGVDASTDQTTPVESEVSGRCLMTFEACEKDNNGEWTRVSDPKAEFVENLKPTLNTECQPDTLTDGRALQREVLFVTAATNGENIIHSLRTTKECTGSVDLQFEDQELGQEFAIYTTRVPCSRVSSEELTDKVDLKYNWVTNLNIATDSLSIEARYSPVADTEGECQDNHGQEWVMNLASGVLCDNEDKCEGKGIYATESGNDAANTGCNTIEDAEGDTKFYKTYEVSTYFGVCRNDNTINFETGGTASATAVINSDSCKTTANPPVEFAKPDSNPDSLFSFTSDSGLDTLIKCSQTTYVGSRCCKNCKCRDSNNEIVKDAALQNEKACNAVTGNVWEDGNGNPDYLDISGTVDGSTCGVCSTSTATTQAECSQIGGSTWTPALDASVDCGTEDCSARYIITAAFMVPSVATLEESYVITYSMAMTYVRRVTENAFGSDNSILQGSGDTGTINYCQDQLFTATIRRDATATVVVAQVKAAELNRAIVVEDIRWIGSSDSAVGGCNQFEYRVEVTFMVMDQDARYQYPTKSFSDSLDYWEPAELTAAMVDTAADAINPNNIIMKTVTDSNGADVTVLRKPGLRCSDSSIYDTNDEQHLLCETYDGAASCQTRCTSAGNTLSEVDLPGVAGDQYHFKALGTCVRITQCLTNANDNNAPIEESDDGINGNSWADYSKQYIFDLVVRGIFLKAEVDTKIEVTSNFQECPVTDIAAITGVPRIGVQLSCFEPVDFASSAVQYLPLASTAAEGVFVAEGFNNINTATPAIDQRCIDCSQIPVRFIDIAPDAVDDHSNYGIYNIKHAEPFCTGGADIVEESCTEPYIWLATPGPDTHTCCPMDCSAAYADDLAKVEARVFVTDAEDSPLTYDGWKVAKQQQWTVESSEIFIERYDTSTRTATTDATLIGEVKLCTCPDPAPGMGEYCKVENTKPYGQISNFNTHQAVSQHCLKNGVRDNSITSSGACDTAGGEWQDGINEYFMACGYHTDTRDDTASSLNGKKEGANDGNIYIDTDPSTDLSRGKSGQRDFFKAQVNLMPLSEAPADEFRIRFDVILTTGRFNERRRLRTSHVIRKPLKAVELTNTAATKGIQIQFRPANEVEGVNAEEPVKHETSDSMETGTVFLIVASSMLGVGLMIWGVTLLMDKGEAASVEETTGLVTGIRSVASAVTRTPRFNNLRY